MIITKGACARGGGRRPGFEATARVRRGKRNSARGPGIFCSRRVHAVRFRRKYPDGIRGYVTVTRVGYGLINGRYPVLHVYARAPFIIQRSTFALLHVACEGNGFGWNSDPEKIKLNSSYDAAAEKDSLYTQIVMIWSEKYRVT